VNVHALCRFYSDRLEEAEREHYALEPCPERGIETPRR